MSEQSKTPTTARRYGLRDLFEHPRFIEYCKANCKWCANSPIAWARVEYVYDGVWHVDELDNKVERCAAPPLASWVKQLVANLDQVDDVLIVDWITVKDNDYRKALADLVTTNIAQHNDPVLMPKITGVAMQHRETKEVVSMAMPARHHLLIKRLVEVDGRPDFPKNCQHGFILENGDFIDNCEARIYAMRTKQIGTRVLTSEDLW